MLTQNLASIFRSNATLPLFISDRRTDTMGQTGEDILASPYDVMEHFVILFRCHIGVIETVMLVVSNRSCMAPTPSHRLGIAKELAVVYPCVPMGCTC
jgi:hypothetical protein